MEIRFWGVRGSIASPLLNTAVIGKIETAVRLAVRSGITDETLVPDFIKNLPRHILLTAGGDTTCVEIDAGKTKIIMDAGSGIRSLGHKMMKDGGGGPVKAHILFSHTHLDHICGIPFFGPAYHPESEIICYSPLPDLKSRLTKLQDPDFFPVPLLKTFSFVQLKENEEFEIDDTKIEPMKLNHPGNSFGYRVTRDGKTVVYATDSEYKDLSTEALRPFYKFFQNADLTIYDAQYTMLENIEKEDWGHSNVFTGIDIALEAGVKRLVFTHHEPVYDDQTLWGILHKANEYLEISRSERELRLYLAYEGARIKI